MVRCCASWSCNNARATPMTKYHNMSINLAIGPTQGTFHILVSKLVQNNGILAAELDTLDFLLYGGTRGMQYANVVDGVQKHEVSGSSN